MSGFPMEVQYNSSALEVCIKKGCKAALTYLCGAYMLRWQQKSDGRIYYKRRVYLAHQKGINPGRTRRECRYHAPNRHFYREGKLHTFRSPRAQDGGCLQGPGRRHFSYFVWQINSVTSARR